MKEQNFQLSGYVDDATAKNIGHLIGVDFLCFGTIIDMGNMVRIAAKLADVQTGEIAAMSSVTYNQNESARFMLELFLNNNVVTIRKNDIVRRFETAGLSGKMTEAGISWQEINAALRNEEF